MPRHCCWFCRQGFETDDPNEKYCSEECRVSEDDYDSKHFNEDGEFNSETEDNTDKCCGMFMS